MPILCTAYTELFEDLHKVTRQSKIDYANRWGMEYREYLHQVPNLVSWERASYWLDAVEDSDDWVLFLGADAAITNPNLSPESFTRGNGDIHGLVGVDGNGYQSDVQWLRNSREVQLLMRQVIQRRTSSPNEQVALQEILSGMAYPVLRSNIIQFKHQLQTKIPDQKNQWYEAEAANSFLKSVPFHFVPAYLLQCYPLSMYDKSSQDQGNDWNPESFVCHIPARPIEQRIEFFKKILP